MPAEQARHRPPEALRPLVAWYSGYRETGAPPARHRGLPSPWLTLIVTLDDPLVISEHPDPHQPASQHQVLVGGLHTAPALVTHDGRQSGIQLGLTPLGARALLGVPAGELATLDLEGDQVLGRFAAELQDRVRSAGTWTGRFAALDALLAARAGLTRPELAPPGPEGRPVPLPRLTGPMDGRGLIAPEVTYAWRTLLARRGAVSVADLAEETGWSSRHLDNRFRSEIGLTPKAAARVIRFDRARRMLMRRARDGGPPALADLAAAGGYYDQAHLAREFRGLAGCPPSRWLAEEFRNVQGPDPGGREGSPS
ncbi:MAG TPA: helix-turn-helix domain-containing protein [Streptosporangiaceae bacterium]|jgi:AraC-like DNA-binding protein|nr:helix-turn-helix domain-containing protein [Streptosporangiaceae bacterium]